MLKNQVKCFTHLLVKKYQLIALSLFLTSSSVTVFANSTSTWIPNTLRTVVSLGVGTAISNEVNSAQTSPIEPYAQHEYYIYDSSRAHQAVSLFDGFIGRERALSSDWSIQYGISYSQTSKFTAEGSFIQGRDVLSEDTFNYRYRLASKQLLVESKLLYTVKRIVHPYISLGAGAAFNRASDYATDVPPFFTFTRMYKDYTEDSLSYRLGTGVDMDISQHFRLGLGYRFADLGEVQLGRVTIDQQTVSKKGLRLTGTLRKSNFYTQEVLAQATYLF